jgi:hypothetical protein
MNFGGPATISALWNRTRVGAHNRSLLVARAQWMAASSVVRARVRPQRGSLPRFVIFSRGRTGSTLLIDLLRCHPMIHCDAEILSHRFLVTNPRTLVHSRSRLFSARAYGFKIRPSHYGTQRIDPCAFIGNPHAERWRFIHLTRRNVLRTALSGLADQADRDRAQETRRERAGEGRVHIRPSDLLARLGRVEQETRTEACLLAPFPHLRLTYEDDLLPEPARQPALGRVFDYLELSPAAVATRYVRLGTDRLQDSVENYSELAEALRGTAYARFLDRE